MYRLYDHECMECGWVEDHLISVPDGCRPPASSSLYCEDCGRVCLHERLISLPAPYMGEVVHNPRVTGGRFDTMGAEKSPSLPTLPPGAGPMDYKYLFSKPEYKELEQERAQTIKRNKKKRQRAAAIAKGENINMRRDRCEGDPKI